MPLALYSERWNILMLVMDSMDLPSMGLEILEKSTAVRQIQYGEQRGMQLKVLYADVLVCYYCDY